jgi:hypothetical protein
MYRKIVTRNITESLTNGPRGPGFDFQRHQIFRIAVGLERGPLVRINEELLERKCSGPGLEN